jgi:mannosyl-3-phosphoglycerate phosphatase
MATGGPDIIIFTDLDATLLDHVSYEWRDAEPALKLCKRLEIPVIVVSSKTRAEIDMIRRDMGLSHPYITENGGAVYFPVGGFEIPPAGAERVNGCWRWSLGVPYHRICEALKVIREELGWRLKGFSEMSLEEISRLTGLNPDVSRLASQREYDEPFVNMDEGEIDLDVLKSAAERRGLEVTVGGRFYHLQGNIGKGEAVARLIGWYEGFSCPLTTVALGDSPNDFGMLARVDYPVLVRSLHEYPELKREIPRLRMTEKMGPKGWNMAVLELIGRKRKGGES